MATALAFAPESASVLVADVTRADDIKSAPDAAVEQFGRLDIAFNDARTEQPEMTRRSTGDTDEGRAAVIAQEPIGRMARPEEIGAAALRLCSDDAAFTVARAMVVDGGQTA